MGKFANILVALLISSSTLNDPAESIKAEILRYGLYKAFGTYVTVDNPAIPSGKIGTNMGGTVFVRQTDKIPLVFGVHFGYGFRIEGLPGRVVTLKCVVTHPPIRKPSGEVVTRFEYESQFSVVNGVVEDEADYFLNHDYELVPGKWTRAYYYQGRRILYKEFDVSSDYNPR